MTDTDVVAERRGRVALLTLNRPQALNALSRSLMASLTESLAACDRDDAIGCMVLTGSPKAFAAGADIEEMQALTSVEAYLDDFLSVWDRLSTLRKPTIAAVAGYALGGGCELALACDIVVAAENAQFGQPEIKLGVLPGAGGTQRLARAIGKAKAMDLCLTGRLMGAAEAERSGLAARVVPLESLLTEALTMAAAIADKPRAATLAVKESIDRAFETSLSEGRRFERRLFYSLFATQDQKEGMRAFLEKRAPRFDGR